MNKLLLATTVSILLFTSCSSIQQFKTKNVKQVSLKEFLENPKQFMSFFKKPGKKIIIFLPKGSTLPVDINMKFKPFTFRQGQNKIICNQNLYLYYNTNSLFISPDKLRWTELGNGKGFKELFDFKKGFFSIGLGATKEKGTRLTITVGGK